MKYYIACPKHGTLKWSYANLRLPIGNYSVSYVFLKEGWFWLTVVPARVGTNGMWSASTGIRIRASSFLDTWILYECPVSSFRHFTIIKNISQLNVRHAFQASSLYHRSLNLTCIQVSKYPCIQVSRKLDTRIRMSIDGLPCIQLYMGTIGPRETVRLGPLSRNRFELPDPWWKSI